MANSTMTRCFGNPHRIVVHIITRGEMKDLYIWKQCEECGLQGRSIRTNEPITPELLKSIPEPY